MRGYISKLILVLLTQFMVYMSFCQRKQDDSLRNIIAHASADTAIIDAYQQLCISYQESDPVKAIEYGLLGLQKAKAANTELRTGSILQSIGICYDYKNDLDSCLFYLRSAIVILTRIKRIDKEID